LGIHLLILILFVWLAPHVAFSAEPGCLNCHASHYEDWGNCNFCHRGIQKTGRKDIAHHGLIVGRYAFFRFPEDPIIEQGKQLLSAFACRRCHTAGKMGNHLSADLDTRSNNLQPDEIFAAIKLPSSFMPDFRFTQPQLVALVNRILFNSALRVQAKNEVPLVIHFDVDRTSDKNPFNQYCGKCHKVLTTQDGGLGEGEIGPNLSGLLSEFYPQTFKGQEPWTSDSLEKWLKNPRKIKKTSQMSPVLLQMKEFLQLLKLMGVSVPAKK